MINHVAHPMFAAEFQQEPHRVIELFLEIIQPLLAHQGKLSSVQAEQMLHKAYLTRYGLATDDELSSKPASLVRLRQAEDTYMGTLLEDHFEHFIELEIFKFMTWDKYIAHPRHELEMIRKVCEKRRRLSNNKESQTVKEAEALAKALGG